ncbi:hypothetical protein E4V42_13510 [Clostridium estertheticum]|uniref:DUF7210 domain-containing protein n=1 Tax=Clostridium estertheticum TaxID=238834 RepID=A0A5N7J2Y8_9CLOT|nr:hypothetical protein [Clostridium estertheticum]MPQ32448.1 hypothetical protein [Clostridium estertheticum]MPQ63107.1 hypothetical protein [Clostridium estertheticum]
MINVKALVYLKYNENCYKIGDEFQVNEDDLEEMGKKGVIGPGKEALKEDLNDAPEDLGADVLSPKEGE